MTDKDKEIFANKVKERLIQGCIETHGNRYDYSKVVYNSSKDKMEIICKEHGSFFMIADKHKRGAGCTQCAKIESLEKRTNNFLKRASEVHNGKYDYSKVDYINNSTKVKIICPTHGEFEQRPMGHLQGNPCPYCEKLSRKSKNLTTEEFIRRSTQTHGDKYDYSVSEYKHAKEEVEIICKEHGKFRQIASAHYSGKGCIECSIKTRADKRSSSTEDFIKKSKEIHGEKYNYSKTEYKSAKEDVEIICEYHGIFSQLATVHLRGSGCKECWNLTNIFRREDYIKLSDEATLYIVRLKKGEEDFYKIGKTKNKIKQRLRKRVGEYTYEIIREYRGNSGYIFDIEIELHRKYFSYSYEPNIKFKGYTECYTLDLPIEEVEHTIIQGQHGG